VKNTHNKTFGIALLLCTAGLALIGLFYNLNTIRLSWRTSTPSPGLTTITLTFTNGTSLPARVATGTPVPTISRTPILTSIPKLSPPSHTTSLTATEEPSLLEANCIPPFTLRQTGLVTRVIDGDTIEVQLDDGVISRVRYIGIDAPGRDELWFMESNSANSGLVAGKTITLVKDVSEVDQYDRLLRYVMVEDVFVNYELVRQGLADIAFYPPDLACREAFLQAAQSAREAKIGIWGPLPQPWQDDSDRSNCDPSYPTVCIPPYPPDLECLDIPYRHFEVNPPDPHFFDGDFDGLGCEG
jgi:micrococcal nuclease